MASSYSWPRRGATRSETGTDRHAVGQQLPVGGILPDWRDWSILSRANISFGQGVSVNALQMAAAVNTVANGGERITPSLVSGKVDTSYGTTVGTDTEFVMGLVDLALGSGARVVVVNAEPTPYDDVADLVVREPIGAALPRLVAAPA